MSNNSKLYWTSQLAGWGSLFLLLSINGLLFNEHDPVPVLLNILTATFVGMVISRYYRNYIKQKEWVKLPLGKLTLRILLFSLVLSCTWVLCVMPLSFAIFRPEQNYNFISIIFLVISMSFLYVMWSLFYFFIKLFNRYRKSEIEKWRLKSSVKDAQLIALKSQINPHFIFNSLNNIRSLVIENPEKSRDMITNLSGLLRYSIQFNNAEKVTIADELNIVKTYLDLESIQYEERLSYTIKASPETLGLKIPPMTIQLLVENAIKHGISKLPQGGDIYIECNMVASELNVTVTNTGQITENLNQSNGIGLQNAGERLKLLFGRFTELTLKNLNNTQVEAKFRIPQ